MVRSFLAVLGAATLLSAMAPGPPPGPLPGHRDGEAAPTFHDAVALKSELEAATAGHAAIARLATYGKSRGGRDLWCVELGPIDQPQKARRPALLVVAGLDGQHLVGTELVLDHLRRLVTGYGSDAAVTKLLDEHVVYLIPRANPDGAELYFQPPGGVQREIRGNAKPVDDDRDGALDEDGPEDLNHDGVITTMRWKDPAGTWIEDKDDPRVLKPADPLKGERGVYRVGVEAIDKDGDGECGEDGPGDVVPARNFPQRWAEFDAGAGRVPMEEPETLALGQFLLDRPAIALVVAYGLNDNLAVDAKADAGGDAPAGPGGFRFSRSMPGGIVKEDQPLYAELATRYRETTGVTSKPLLEADDGAFWSFAYFQFGVPTLAMHVWSPPLDVKKPAPAPADGATPDKDSEKKEGEGPEGKDGKDAAKSGEAGAPPADAKPEAKPEAKQEVKPETPPEPRGAEGGGPPSGRPGRGRGRGGGGGDGAGGGAPEAKKADADEPKLLLWNDYAMSGAAFVPWTKVQHPTLGEVEVGGWKPYVRVNPPADAIAELAKKHGDFLVKLGGLFAELRVRDVKVENLGGNLFRVTAAVVNEGWLPSVCGMGERDRRPRPTRLELDLGAAKLIQGERRHTWQRIEGSGGRREVKWLVQAPAIPGANVTLRLWSEKAGDDERVVALQ